MSAAPFIAVSTVTDGSRITYRLETSRAIAAYFSRRRMFVSYDVDVSGIPDALLAIPGLATLAPIAWILGAELHAPAVDAVFLESLRRVRESLERLYPAISWAGEVRPASIVDSGAAYLNGQEALLFSGGVDSVASFVSHREIRPRLVSVWGADVGLGMPRDWEKAVIANRQFAREHSVALSLVETNFRTFFDHYKLRARFFPTFANWYSAVQQGMGLVGLTAPLSYVHGVTRVRIPSSHSVEWVEPWGTFPSIDNEVRWAATEVVHDGYRFSRQEKLGLLAEHIRAFEPRLKLRVCWGRGSNCCRCAKCCLTMIGLALEGLDPNQHGFSLDAAALSFIRRALDGGSMRLSNFQAWLWKEIQRQAPGRKPLHVDGLDDFFAWLESVSIADCQAKLKARAQRPSARVERFVLERPGRVGRWLRTWYGHPFP